MSGGQHTTAAAETAATQYARAMRTNNCKKVEEIEVHWGLYGYTPEIVSTVLACIATGLPRDAAIAEATGV